MMLIMYMSIWSIVMIVVLGAVRARTVLQIAVMTAVTMIVLFTSQALFEQLSLSAGLAPNMILFDPGRYANAGLVGWLALMVMPCGWLGPILGLHLIERWLHQKRVPDRHEQLHQF